MPFQTYSDNDELFVLVKKILENMSFFNDSLTSIANSTGSGGGGGSISTQPDINVAVAGTRMQGTPALTPRGVMVVAKLGNTGPVYVGGPETTNAGGNSRGIQLFGGGMTSAILPVSNLDQVYVNADNAGDGVGVVIF